MTLALKTERTAEAAVADLFGGPRALGHKLTGPLDAHDMLLKGLPGKALTHFVDNLVMLQREPSLEKAMGMSLRTFQRRRDARPLSREQSGRAWKFAEILARAIEIFGSQEEAERWLDQPAPGLEQRRPLDLLATPAGVEMVETLLARLEYGVYA